MLIGAHSTAFVKGQSLQESVNISKELGFDAFEIFADVQNNNFGSPCVGYWAAGYERNDWRRVAKILDDKFRLLTIHAPLEGSGTNITASNPGIRMETVKQISKTIEFASFVDAEVVVVHPGRQCYMTPMAEYIERSRSALKLFSDKGERLNVKIALENPAYGSMEKQIEVVASLESEYLGIALDTGHCPGFAANRNDADSVNDALERTTRAFSTYLLNVHAHDYDFQRDHRGLGRGCFDWQRFFNVLAEVGYDGGVMLEINEEDDIEAMVKSKEILEACMMRER